MNKISVLVVALVFAALGAHAQVGINILIPDSSAVLQLESNKKGLGLPRLTTPQRDAIVSPLKGLTIFNTQDSLIEYWNGECWLKAYERNCYECDFTMTIDDPTDTIDRVISDSSFSTITVKQTHGNQDINLIYLATLPQGVSVHFNGNPTIDSAGTIDIVVKVDMCSPVGGNYPIIIQAFCEDKVKFLSYNIYIRPPVQITVPTDQYNYDLQAMNNLPPSPAQFVLLNISNAVTIHSTNTTTPAYTTGNLDANSVVCIVNDGDILGHGGDGGSFTFNGNLFVAGGMPGYPGGDAMNLTTRTYLINNGAIYGGGSGGGSVGLAIGTPSIPIIGSIAIGFGYCGGGGSELGKGGAVNQNGGITIGLFEPGDSATCCATSIPGQGHLGIYPITIPVSIANINITPNIHGGNGGGFGQSGTPGYLDVQLEVCINIPIIGNICIPIPIPGGILPFYGPASGAPGWAIKRNNKSLNGLPDGNYSSAQVKGIVGP
jgi:hypothetical protein